MSIFCIFCILQYALHAKSAAEYVICIIFRICDIISYYFHIFWHDARNMQKLKIRKHLAPHVIVK